MRRQYDIKKRLNHLNRESDFYIGDRLYTFGSMKNGIKKITILLLFAVAIVLHSCDDNEPTPSTNNQPQALCDSLAITYTGHIKLIVDASCNTTYCHGTGIGGFNLGTFAEVKTAAKKTNWLGAIKHESGFEAMPKGGSKLSDTQIQQLECWEKTGFKEN